MISDVANWVLINVLTNTRVFTSLLALIIMIVASFLLSKKSTEKSPFRSRRVWGVLLSVFAMFIFLFANIADIADVFTVWATLVLAGAAILSFEESRRLRKQYKEKEEHDRKEGILNEIIEWAIDVGKCGLEKDLPDTSRISDMNEGKLHLAYSLNILAKTFQSLRGRNQYTSQIVLTFSSDLQKAAKALINDIEEHINLLDALSGIITVKFVSITKDNLEEYLAQLNMAVTQIGEHKLRLEESTSKVIKEAVKIKTKDIS